MCLLSYAKDIAFMLGRDLLLARNCHSDYLFQGHNLVEKSPAGCATNVNAWHVTLICLRSHVPSVDFCGWDSRVSRPLHLWYMHLLNEVHL